MFVKKLYHRLWTSDRRIFTKKLIHGYHLKNWIECRRNRSLLGKARNSLRQNASNEPLISVIVPTYNKSKVLAERAIRSVLAQTYSNFELIVVGDHCTDNTEDVVKEFHDGRIRFFNLAERGKYPSSAWDRWMVAGSVPRNRGLELASGEWIAPLDDDDEFSNDHLELLLRHAQQNRYEMVYGIAQMEMEPGKWVECGSLPLRYKHICHLSVLYSSRLKFFRYDVNAWKYVEPDDWNLWRRMKEAGVRIGFLNHVVGKHYLELSRFNV